MVEWKTFWKDVEEAFKEITRITKTETLNENMIEHAMTGVAIFYKQNRETTIAAQKSPDSDADNAPTEKQINFAKKLGIDTPESKSKSELSKLIQEKIKDQ